jgi:hypothetical protein
MPTMSITRISLAAIAATILTISGSGICLADNGDSDWQTKYPLESSALAKNGAEDLVVRGADLDGSMARKIFLDGVKDDKVIWSKKFPIKADFNMAKFFVEAKGNTITLDQEFPGLAAHQTERFRWNGTTLTLIDDKQEDPSTDAIDLCNKIATTGTRAQLERAEKQDDLTIMYPGNYIQGPVVASLIEKVHGVALKNYRNGELEKAIDRLSLGLDCAEEMGHNVSGGGDGTKWFGVFGDDQLALKPKQYIPAINDYAFFLQEAGKNSEAIPLLRRVLEKDSGRTVAYLNLADALWATGDKAGAKKMYVEYVSRAGKDKSISIPPRATERSSS